MPHLDDGTLHALIDGEIGSDALRPLHRHLEGCAECRQRLDAAREDANEALNLVELLDPPPAEPGWAPETPAPPSRRWRRLAWAASVFLAAGIGYSIRDQLLPSRTKFPAPAQETAVTTGLTAPSTVQLPDSPTGYAFEAPTRELPLPAPSAASPSRQLAADRDAGEPAVPRTNEESRALLSKTEPALESPSPVVGGRLAQLDSFGGDEVFRAQREVSAPIPATRTAEARRAPSADAPLGDGVSRSADALASLRAPIPLDSALAWGGGRLRVLFGLAPTGIDRAADTVRIHYIWGGRAISLIQIQRADSVELRFDLPADYPADSLALLRRLLTRP